MGPGQWSEKGTVVFSGLFVDFVLERSVPLSSGQHANGMCFGNGAFERSRTTCTFVFGATGECVLETERSRDLEHHASWKNRQKCHRAKARKVKVFGSMKGRCSTSEGFCRSSVVGSVAAAVWMTVERSSLLAVLECWELSFGVTIAILAKRCYFGPWNAVNHRGMFEAFRFRCGVVSAYSFRWWRWKLRSPFGSRERKEHFRKNSQIGTSCYKYYYGCIVLCSFEGVYFLRTD